MNLRAVAILTMATLASIGTGIVAPMASAAPGRHPSASRAKSDFNGDGFDDLAVGVPLRDMGPRTPVPSWCWPGLPGG